jgi:hypothetical protein
MKNFTVKDEPLADIRRHLRALGHEDIAALSDDDLDDAIQSFGRKAARFGLTMGELCTFFSREFRDGLVKAT